MEMGGEIKMDARMMAAGETGELEGEEAVARGYDPDII